MKDKCILTKLIDSNKAYWINFKPSTFKQSCLSQLKLFETNVSKVHQTNLIESDKSKVHSNKANWFKWILLNQMKAKCIQTKLIDSNKAY